MSRMTRSGFRFCGGRGISQSSGRGLAILGCFTSQRHVLGVAEIADELGMSRSTTYRFVIVLVALGFLEQCASRKYRLGSRSSDLDMSVLNLMGLRVPSRPYLEELRERTSYASSLAVLDGVEILYVERARSFRCGEYEVDSSLRLGSRLPAYCTSMGKVLLASLPEGERRDLIGNVVFLRRGPNTIGGKKALHVELERVVDEGMAVDDEESADGLVSMACPVRGESRRVVAAIDLAAHASMISLEGMVEQFLPHLLAAADNISARLGFRRDDGKAL